MQRCVKSALLVLVLVNVCSGDVAGKEFGSLWNVDARVLNLANLIENYRARFIYQENDNEVNGTCDRDLQLFQQALLKNDEWALQMLDASSKLPSGILQGNTMDLGMYDECVAIDKVISTDVRIRGRHCMYTPIIVWKNASLPLPQLSISVCLPASCSADDVAKFIELANDVIQWEDLTVYAGAVTCSTGDKEIWDTEFTVFLSIFTAYVAFLLACSIYDALSETIDGQISIFRKFSLQRNAAAILSTKVKAHNLPVLHGLRVFSMAWVVLGHEFILNMAGVIANKIDLLVWIQSWTSLYIFTAPYAVDSFFTLSGFLMTYIFLKQISNHKSFNVPMYYIHRYIRLTPPIIALLVASLVVIPKLGSGPRWETFTNLLMGKCNEKWWHILLYLQNFIEKDNICLAHLWYLAVDMQLFLISPLILYPLHKVPKIGLGITTLLIAASLSITAWIIAINEYRLLSFSGVYDIKKMIKAFQDVYEVPYVRAGPWLIGIILGYEIAKNNRKLSNTRVWAGWLLAVLCFSFCIFGTRFFMEPDYKYDVVWETFFATVSRPVWAIGICWIIYASVNGRAGIIHRILSWKGFLPLSRLSYCIYLVHFVIQIVNAANVRTTSYFTDYFVWRMYFGDLMMSVLIAFLFSLLFESPILVLEKVILKGSR